MNRFLMTVSASFLAGTLSLGLVGTPVFGQNPAAPRADRGKGVIERPAKDILARAAAATDNPAVQPGKVKWQPTFEAACEAAKISGKPVLLFQMLGRLDQQFC